MAGSCCPELLPIRACLPRDEPAQRCGWDPGRSGSLTRSARPAKWPSPISVSPRQPLTTISWAVAFVSRPADTPRRGPMPEARSASLSRLPTPRNPGYRIRRWCTGLDGKTTPSRLAHQASGGGGFAGDVHENAGSAVVAGLARDIWRTGVSVAAPSDPIHVDHGRRSPCACAAGRGRGASGWRGGDARMRCGPRQPGGARGPARLAPPQASGRDGLADHPPEAHPGREAHAADEGVAGEQAAADRLARGVEVLEGAAIGAAHA